MQRGNQISTKSCLNAQYVSAVPGSSRNVTNTARWHRDELLTRSSVVFSGCALQKSPQKLSMTSQCHQFITSQPGLGWKKLWTYSRFNSLNSVIKVCDWQCPTFLHKMKMSWRNTVIFSEVGSEFLGWGGQSFKPENNQEGSVELLVCDVSTFGQLWDALKELAQCECEYKRGINQQMALRNVWCFWITQRPTQFTLLVPHQITFIRGS